MRDPARGRRSRALPAICAAALAPAILGCAALRRPLALPSERTPYVAVLSGEMGPPIDQVSRHSWIVANSAEGRDLLRYELLGHGERKLTRAPLDYFGHGDVALHGVIEPGETIHDYITCLDAETIAYNKQHPNYWMFPGPNSNTFVDHLLRRCDIRVDLPSTAIGKDYRGVAGVSLTSGGTGVQLETLLGGVRVGLTEGVEIHILGIAFGVDLWPPALIVPVNPGRLGFDDR